MLKLMPIVPAIGAFGPLLIVIGMDSPYHIVSYIGSLTTSVALLLVYSAVMKLLKTPN